MSARLLFIDCETTGLDPKENDIVELAGQIYINNQFVEKFLIRSRPIKISSIQKEALKVNGKTEEEILSYPKPVESVKKLDKILERYYGGAANPYILIAHNIDFDRDFLMNWFLKTGQFNMIKYFNKDIYVCTLALARYAKSKNLIIGAKNNLKALSKQLNVQLENAHTADDDCQALVNIYYKIDELIRNQEDQLKLF